MLSQILSSYTALPIPLKISVIAIICASLIVFLPHILKKPARGTKSSLSSVKNKIKRIVKKPNFKYNCLRFSGIWVIVSCLIFTIAQTSVPLALTLFSSFFAAQLNNLYYRFMDNIEEEPGHLAVTEGEENTTSSPVDKVRGRLQKEKEKEKEEKKNLTPGLASYPSSLISHDSDDSVGNQHPGSMQKKAKTDKDTTSASKRKKCTIM